ncbi:hypothetical protein Micbo1qcDRAFT_204512 [Microdochium bolleyi]|uniref:Uncharacterized protein n=1 Tax=Microdochium bolleyi TaxID=196109 RepID=A0A136J256_9PEZI|nr:hypothetical protein Micbo1qcDRAFT_204512 [Microdochium bolleyi]
MKGQMPTPDTISKESFKEYLGRYEEVARSLSDSKPPKPGAKTLLELDDFRYNEAVNAFSSPKPKRQMDHDDVKTRHGKFRPTLMNLVSSNDSAKVASTIKDAMAAYWKTKDAAAALTAISALKGIGPATAALLLSVHDPDDVIFFSDEAFWWLCCGGQKGPIKYNSKEYKQLSDAARELKDGIGASAMEIEKVAYVLFKGDNVDVEARSKKTAGGKVPESISKRPMTKPEPEEDTTRTKRKPTKEVEESSAGLRRSKRGKA